jgi:integrase
MASFTSGEEQGKPKEQIQWPALSKRDVASMYFGAERNASLAALLAGKRGTTIRFRLGNDFPTSSNRLARAPHRRQQSALGAAARREGSPGLRKDVTRHSLGHSLATYRLKSGSNVYIVQGLLGHGACSVRTPLDATAELQRRLRGTSVACSWCA